MPVVHVVRRFTAVTALFLIASAPVLAQPGPNPERMKERLQSNNEALINVLAMSDEQDAVVRPILAASLEKRAKLMDDAFVGGFDRDKMTAMRIKMEAVDKETRAELAGVLTDDQMKAYDRFLADHARTRGRRRSARQQF